MQRCVFLLNPFFARRWRRRYDLMISIVLWVAVSLACTPFIVMRTTNKSNSTQTFDNMSCSRNATSTQNPLDYTSSYVPPVTTSPSGSSSSSKGSCFKDLPTRHLSPSVAITIMVFAEMLGFVIPLACIGYSSFRITQSLNRKYTQDQQNSTAINPSARSRLQSITSNCQDHEKQTSGEKRRALRMVLSCTALFLFCFAPYHLNFMLYLMVSQDIVSHCATRLAVLQFHPVSLCIASLSCCLNPLLYYYLTDEFRSHLTRRTSSFTSSLLSSPITSPRQRPAQHRLTSMESSISSRD